MAPPVQRIKLDRKTLREPDEFQTLTSQAAEWGRRHRTALTAIALGIVALALLTAGLGWWRSRQATAAAVRFQSAYDDFQAKRYAEAAAAFEGLGRDYAGTASGRLAALYEGHALQQKPDLAAAAAAYERYLRAGPQADYLRQEALLRLGGVREAAGNAPGAQEAYEEAAGLSGPFTTEARLSLARMLEAAGQTDKAREQYVAVLKESPSASVRALLETKVPADVAAAADAPR
jgi:predicted negative regulator of RcsB-dependent stress response